jgi:hypothetical protein
LAGKTEPRLLATARTPPRSPFFVSLSLSLFTAGPFFPIIRFFQLIPKKRFLPQKIE